MHPGLMKKSPAKPNNSMLWEGESECTGQRGFFFRERSPSRAATRATLVKEEGRTEGLIRQNSEWRARRPATLYVPSRSALQLDYRQEAQEG